MSFIGVFDSGIGGLSVLNALIAHFPEEHFIYIADTKNIPFGNKTQKELTKICCKHLNYFQNAKAIVVACNTMNSLLEDLPQPPQPLFGILDGLVDTVIDEFSHISQIGILGTVFTVKHNSYQKKILNRCPKLTVYQVAAPLLASAIEKHDASSMALFEHYFSFFPKNTDYFILGCTHYNLLIKKIQQKHKNLSIIPPYSGIINNLKNFLVNPSPLKEKKSENISLTPRPLITFLTTAYSDQLQKNSEQIMKKTIIWEEITL